MSRDAFEKWYEEEHGTEFGQDYRNDDVIEKGFMAGYQAATKHAQARIAELEAAQQWIPYKEGDSVPEGRYEVTHLCSWTKEPLVNVEYHGQTGWTTLAVTAYRQLPTPFVPEVSDD